MKIARELMGALQAYVQAEIEVALAEQEVQGADGYSEFPIARREREDRSVAEDRLVALLSHLLPTAPADEVSHDG